MIHGDLAEVLDVLEKDKKIYEIFKSCPYYILKQIRVKHYAEGEFALEQGQVYDTIYMIVEGKVEISVESEQGKRFYFSPYKKGNFIGELETFNRMPYMCQVVAMGKLTTLELSRDIFTEWLRVDLRFHDFFTSFICNGHYESMLEMCVQMLYPLKQKICRFLIERAKENGSKYTYMNAETIAERMGVTTRSAHRILKELREKGIIGIQKSNVVILDMERLQLEKEE